MPTLVMRAFSRTIEENMDEVIYKNMDVKCLNEDMLLGRNKWERIIHATAMAEVSFISCCLPQVFGIKGIVVIIADMHKLIFY